MLVLGDITLGGRTDGGGEGTAAFLVILHFRITKEQQTSIVMVYL